ncbi:hypothetical protein [Leifsonia sp. Le1]
MRLLAIHITGRGDELLSSYRDGNNFYAINQVLDAYGLRVDVDGDWHRDE